MNRAKGPNIWHEDVVKISATQLCFGPLSKKNKLSAHLPFAHEEEAKIGDANPVTFRSGLPSVPVRTGLSSRTVWRTLSTD